MVNKWEAGVVRVLGNGEGVHCTRASVLKLYGISAAVDRFCNYCKKGPVLYLLVYEYEGQQSVLARPMITLVILFYVPETHIMYLTHCC